MSLSVMIPMYWSAVPPPRLIGKTYTPPAGFELGQPEPVQLGLIWFFVGGRRFTPSTTSERQLICVSAWLLSRMAEGCCETPFTTEPMVLEMSPSNAMRVTC